jgi:hypothetical protein
MDVNDVADGLQQEERQSRRQQHRDREGVREPRQRQALMLAARERAQY